MTTDIPPVTEQTLDLLKELRQAAAEEDHGKIVQTIGPSLLFEDRLDPNRESDQAIVMAVYDIYVKSLLIEGEFDRVVQLLSQAFTKQQANRKQGQTAKNAVAPLYVANQLEPARVYGMYRLERYEAAKQAAAGAVKKTSSSSSPQAEENSMDSWLLQHIEAQAMYHMQDYTGAYGVYCNLLEQQEDRPSHDATSSMTETLQLLNNVVALSCSHMIPFLRSVDALATHRTQLANVLEEQDNLKKKKTGDTSNTQGLDYAADLAYNMATYDLCTAGHDGRVVQEGRGWMQSAMEKTQELGAAEEWTTEEISKQLAPMEWNLEWSRLLWQGGSMASSSLSSTKQASMATRMVALGNQALNTATLQPQKAGDAVRLLPKPSDKLFVPLQNNLLWYNRAVLLYRADQIEECQKTCDEWSQCMQVVNANKSKKKANKNTPQESSDQASSNGATNKIKISMSPMESLFWGCRLAVLESLCLAKKGQRDGAVRRLQSQAETLTAQAASMKPSQDDTMEDDVIGHLLLYVNTHCLLIENPDGVSSEMSIRMLQSLPESIQGEKAVIATLASLHHKLGQEEKAHQILKESGNEEALSDFLLTQGKYEEVADICQGRTDVVSRARYVQVLSYVNPEQAYKEWTSLEPELDTQDETEFANGAELELKELPRLKSSKPRSGGSVGLTETSSGVKTNKKSHEAVLRRRARKREEYLAKLEETKSPFRTQQPDPERWLPKYERSYNRRRRNRQNQQQHKGAQGGVSEKDAAKLDVAARQAARNNDNNNNADGERSTAHMAAVSSGGPSRKTGRRRN